jgi:hypothetical protein
MAALVASCASSSTNTKLATSAAVDTTGATLLVVVAVWGTSNAPTISDNRGNTWTPRTKSTDTNTVSVQVFDCVNPTSVGPGHTFTADGGTHVIYPWVGVYAFSGTDSGAYENAAGHNGTGTFNQPGSLTPAENGAILITGNECCTGTAVSCSSGFTSQFQPYSPGYYYCSGAGYQIQGTSSAINPTWSWTGSNYCASVLAAYRPSLSNPITASAGNVSTLAIGAPVTSSVLPAAAGIATGAAVGSPAMSESLSAGAGITAGLVIGTPVMSGIASGTAGIGSGALVGTPAGSPDLAASVGLVSSLIVGSSGVATTVASAVQAIESGLTIGSPVMAGDLPGLVGIAAGGVPGSPTLSATLAVSAGGASGLIVGTASAAAAITLSDGTASALTIGTPVMAGVVTGLVGIASGSVTGSPALGGTLAASAGSQSGLIVGTASAAAAVTLSAGTASALSIGTPVMAGAITGLAGIAAGGVAGSPALSGTLAASAGLASGLIVGPASGVGVVTTSSGIGPGGVVGLPRMTGTLGASAGGISGLLLGLPRVAGAVYVWAGVESAPTMGAPSLSSNLGAALGIGSGLVLGPPTLTATLTSTAGAASTLVVGSPGTGVVYRIYAGNLSGGPIDYTTCVATTSLLTWTMPSGLPPNSSQRFGVRVYDSASQLEDDNLDAQVVVELDGSGKDVTLLPFPPIGLTAAARASGGCVVSWGYLLPPGAPVPTGFSVWITAGNSVDYAASPAATVPYSSKLASYSTPLSGLTGGSTYSIGVRASNSAGTESNSLIAQVVGVTTGPASPDCASGTGL